MHKLGKIILPLIFGLGANTLAIVAQAQTSADSTAAKLNQQLLPFLLPSSANLSSALAIPRRKAFRADFSLTTNTNGENNASPDKQFNSDILLKTTYLHLGGQKTAMILLANKDYRGERKLALDNPYLEHLTKSAELAEGITVKGLFRIFAPVSETARKDEKLTTSIYLAPNFSIDLNKYHFNGISIGLRPYTKIYFHQYTVSMSGTSSTQYSVGQRATASLDITDKLQIALLAVYQRSRTYTGTTSDSYTMDQSIGYSLLENLSLSLGHTNGGSALASDGKRASLDLMNQRKDTYYFDMSVNF